MSRFRLPLLALVLLSLVPGGCGIKPDRLDPPPGAESDSFPRTYPTAEADSARP